MNSTLERTVELAKRAMLKQQIRPNVFIGLPQPDTGKPAKAVYVPIEEYTTRAPKGVILPKSPRIWIRFILKRRHITDPEPTQENMEGSWAVSCPEEPNKTTKHRTMADTHNEAIKFQDMILEEFGYTYETMIAQGNKPNQIRAARKKKMYGAQM